MRGLLSTAVLASLLVVTGCGGCGSTSSTGTTSDGQPEPAVSQQPGSEPSAEPPSSESSPPTKPNKPTKRPKKPIKPKTPEPSEAEKIEKAVEKLKSLGALVDRPKVSDNTYGPVRGVYMANNNRNARKAMRYVAELPSIKVLHITGGSITDTEMFYLFGLKNLESLKLKDTRVTSAGLAYLQDKHKLFYLNLIESNKIDDSGIKYLYNLKNLRTLLLGGTKVSREAADELKKRIPKLNVK